MPKASYLILFALIIIFVVHSLFLNFTQDDAFISYRYVKNFTSGNGLVFNSGERVEGYTNFLWIIVLSIFSGLGLNIIVISKILGVTSGCISLFLLYKISSLFFPKKDWLFSLFPPLLLTASSAFVYWSISGLETTLFVAMVLLSLYLYLNYSPLWVVTCAVCTLIRPEGVLIFGILFLYRLLFEKTPWRKSLFELGEFVLLLLPFLIFKLVYYGDILPNPFYAKTGFSLEYMKSGLEYFWLFLKHYGLWGLIYLIPLFLYKSLELRGRLLVWLVYLYTLYVIVIGGDVLQVHRFFLPILPLLCLLVVWSVRNFLVKFKHGLGTQTVASLMFLLMSAIFFLFPFKWIRSVRANEKNLVESTRLIADYLNKYYGDDFSIAATTIGSISYYLGTKVRVIDMLGLTDRYISKNPEINEGITATWKEKKYNARYLLSLDPDFTLFSTGYKPSAPAERALLLNSKFRDNYYIIPIPSGQTEFRTIFKRKGEYLKENKVFSDPQFIDPFCDGVYLQLRGRYREAIQKLKKAASVGPDDFAWVYWLIGECYYQLEDYPSAEIYLKKAIGIDDWSVMAHAGLLGIYQKQGRSKEAVEESRKILFYDPNFPW